MPSELPDIAGYDLVRELGSGGWGTVYEALARPSRERVAVKRMHPHLAGDAAHSRRFLDEAEVLRSVSHRGLVQVRGAGRQDGVPFLVMEFLDGEQLKAALDALKREGERMGAPRALRLGVKIADAICEVHRRGFVHRDLKPENIFLLGVNGRERIKVLDFGIARRPDSCRTTTGTVLGTPAYMAPEQTLGAELVTDRTDVYALGVMLHEMLAGSPPFPETSPLLLMECQRSKVPPLLGERVSGLPAGLEELVRDMLAKDPRQRPSMNEVHNNLRKIERARPAVSGPVRLAPPVALPPEPAGGPYHPAWHIVRERAERDARSYLCTPGKPVILWGPEKFGKTWLAEALLDGERRRLGGACRTARLSLDFFGGECRDDYRRFLRELAQQLFEELDLPCARVEEVMDAEGDRAEGKRLTVLMRQILREREEPLYLFIDRADAILDQKFRDDFFGLLRGWAERAYSWPEMGRLRLILAVSTTPIRLTRDIHKSPFSGLSEPIALEELDLEQALRLGQLYGRSWQGERAVADLMALVGGHPYLLRLAMHQCLLHGMNQDRLCCSDIFDQHLRHCRRVLEGEPGLQQVLRRVAKGEDGVDIEAYERLHRLGLLVRDRGGRCALRCSLYSRLAE